ncbi:uncharacterized protein LOC144109823 [Amblyomma americanum]
MMSVLMVSKAVENDDGGVGPCQALLKGHSLHQALMKQIASMVVRQLEHHHHLCTKVVSLGPSTPLHTIQRLQGMQAVFLVTMKWKGNRCKTGLHQLPDEFSTSANTPPHLV